jgi:hypothetical protein
MFLRTSPICLAALLIVSCGSPQGLEEDQFPDQYDQAATASGGTSGAPVGNAGRGGSGGSANLGGTSGNGGAGGSSGSGATNGGSGGTGSSGSAGSGNASGAGGSGSGQAGTSGTGGSGGAQQQPAGNCPDDITLLFNRPSAQGGCADGGCHVANGFPPDLVSPNVEMRLLNVASNCQSRPYIGAADSFLLEKLEDSTPGCGGAQMPFLAVQNLSAADRQCIANWIDDVGGGG